MTATPLLNGSVAEEKSTAILIKTENFQKPLSLVSVNELQKLNLCSVSQEFYFTPFHKVEISNNMELAQVEMQPQSVPVRVVYGNAMNFKRIKDSSEIRFERPLVVDAWAQTTLEDFGVVDSLQQQEKSDLQLEIDALRAKVALLESDLRMHVDLLNQIHTTTALKLPFNQRRSTEPITTTPPVTSSMCQQQPQQPQQQQKPHYQQHQRQRLISPVTPTNVNYSQPNEVITPQIINSGQAQGEHGMQMPSSTSTDSFKYTIVGNTCEPIEIQLAEEDGALNLNNSADSGRLEICLSADEQNKENYPKIKRKIKKERKSGTPPLPPQSGFLVKRGKFSLPIDENQGESPAFLSHIQNNGYNNQQTPLSTHQPNNHHQTADDMPSTSGQTISAQTSQMISPTNKSANVLRHQNDNTMTSIGPNNTLVPAKIYDSLTWESASICTRKLMAAIFDRPTMATHSMTGKPSPAFKGQSKPRKQRLNPNVIEDIIYAVTRKCRTTEKEVRNAVTTKCADENKMYKLDLKRETENNQPSN